MGKIPLQDFRLGDYILDNLPLLRRLRSGLLRTGPAVCIERARHVTRFLRDAAPQDQPIILRYAGAVAHFLSRKQPLFFDDNLNYLYKFAYMARHLQLKVTGGL